MATQEHLQWFRTRLQATASIAKTDVQAVLDWREKLISETSFSAELVGLDDVRGWKKTSNGNVVHDTGQFFSLEGVRIKAGELREVKSWDQPILNQPEGGVLGLVARDSETEGVQFLLQAKAEPGNLGWLQLCPSIQCTWSNLRKAHQGRAPPLSEVMLANEGVRVVYQAQHNEEGGRFWRKSNENIIYFLDDEAILTTDLSYFCWVSLAQLKGLALVDNILSPFVKSIIAPL